MMTSLFSVFDPISMCTGNWLVPLSVMIVLSSCMWFTSWVGLVYNSMWTMVKELMLILHSKEVNLIVCISLFMFILLCNLPGLFPYVFTSTSHFSITISLGLPLWMGCFVFGWYSDFMYSLSHLVPIGTSLVLIPFMVVIELISSLIRPLTLSLRLGVNMLAGHMLLSLIGDGGMSMGVSLMIQNSMQSVLFVLEIAVAIIQAYVFSVLMSLYFKE